MDESRVREIVREEISAAMPADYELLHHSPVSPHCEAILAKPPLCHDFKGIRAWILCRSWQRMEEEKLTTLPVGVCWAEVRKACRTE